MLNKLGGCFNMLVAKKLLSTVALTSISLMALGTLNASADTSALVNVKREANGYTTYTYVAAAKPKVTNLKVSYSDKTQAIKLRGNCHGVSKLTLTYNGKKLANVNVKNGKFNVSKKFKGYGTFRLLKGKTNLKTITSSQYASQPVMQTYAKATKTGTKVGFKNTKNATIYIKKSGKTVKSYQSKGTKTAVTLSKSLTKGAAAKHFTVVEKVANRKISKAVKIKYINTTNSTYIYR